MLLSYVNFEIPIIDIDISDPNEEPVKESGEADKPTLVPCGDEMNTLNLGTEKNKRELRIVNNEELEDMIQLLKEFIDIFAWGYDDMPGLDPQIVTHKIPLIPKIVPIKQKLRRMNPHTLLKVRNEVKK